MSRLSGARRLACEVGAAVRERDAFAGDVLDARLRTAELSAADAAFARVLALGVAATWGTLDEVINRCLNSSHDVHDNVRDALRVSTYEIIFLKKDAYAAVDQGVALVASVERRAMRLANAVLRKIATAAEEFPFGDPETDDAALARLHGFPLWLARVLIEQLGREGAAAFMDASNHVPALYIGVNALQAVDAQIERQFEAAGYPVNAVSAELFGLPGAGVVPGCYKVPAGEALTNRTARRLFYDGKILASDAAAQHIAALALPEQFPESYLEIGSGRGTKTMLLQSGAVRRWGRQLRLTCVDSHGFKADLLRRRADQFGATIDRVVTADARNLKPTIGKRKFQAVLVDAPCSGLGTLRRHPEIRWRIKPAEVNELADQGLSLLCEAARHVAPGGQLTYATCTVLVQENEFVIKRFLETEEGKRFKIAPYAATPAGKPVLFFKSTLTPEGPDTHFAAKLIRTE